MVKVAIFPIQKFEYEWHVLYSLQWEWFHINFLVEVPFRKNSEWLQSFVIRVVFPNSDGNNPSHSYHYWEHLSIPSRMGKQLLHLRTTTINFTRQFDIPTNENEYKNPFTTGTRIRTEARLTWYAAHAHSTNAQTAQSPPQPQHAAHIHDYPSLRSNSTCLYLHASLINTPQSSPTAAAAAPTRFIHSFIHILIDSYIPCPPRQRTQDKLTYQLPSTTQLIRTTMLFKRIALFAGTYVRCVTCIFGNLEFHGKIQMDTEISKIRDFVCFLYVTMNSFWMYVYIYLYKYFKNGNQ